MTTTESTVVHVDGEEGLLSAIPVMLGFHPTDSLVVVCLTGTHHRVGPVMRTDLSDCAADTARVGDLLAVVATRHADEAALIVYGGAPPRKAIEAITRAIGKRTPCQKVLYIGNEPQPVNSRLAAEVAATGRSVLPTRGDLASSVAYHPAAPADPYATVFAAMSAPASRDAYLATAIGDRAAIPTLIGAAQAVPDTAPIAADLLAVLAAVAYRHGEGALAQCALTRAAAAQPGHCLTGLLQEAVGTGINPDALAALANIPVA